MHRLASSFILGYHGCDFEVGERILWDEAFLPSDNDYDWLGPGIYFWEANPRRGLEFAAESAKRTESRIATPFVIGAIIDLGLCLDLTTSNGVGWAQIAYESFSSLAEADSRQLPRNSPDRLKRTLDCSVLRHLHSILDEKQLPAVDTIKGIFTEGAPAYPGAGFLEKTHTQIAVRNPRCIKGVFRVTPEPLQR